MRETRRKIRKIDRSGLVNGLGLSYVVNVNEASINEVTRLLVVCILPTLLVCLAIAM